MLLKLREQIASATRMTTPRTYSLRDGVSFSRSHFRPQLRHRLSPLFQPGRRSRRPGRSELEFCGEPSQVVGHVDVVKRIGEADGKLRSRARASSASSAVLVPMPSPSKSVG